MTEEEKIAIEKQKSNLRIWGIALIVLAILSGIVIFGGWWPLIKEQINAVLNYHERIAAFYWVLIAGASIWHYVATKDKRDIDREGITLGLNGPAGLFFSFITCGGIFQSCIFMVNGIFKELCYDIVFIDTALGKEGCIIIAWPMAYLLWETISIWWKLVLKTYVGAFVKAKTKV